MVFAVLGVVLSPGLFAQDARGSISGRVTDPSGSVIPEATVTVTNLGTNLTVTAQTNEVGAYEVPFLLPGSYRISGSRTGFKTAVRDKIELRTADNLAIDLSLQLGATTERVTVTADTPLLETSTATVGQTVDQRRMADLPIAHGNPYLLMTLTGGVAFTQNAAQDRPYEPGGSTGYTLGGTPALRSEITLDGSPNTMVSRTAGNYAAGYTPPGDAVQELRVEAANFEASSGHTQGGATSIVLKSGTNDFHGTAYYSIQSPKLTANTFFNNLQGKPKGEFTYARPGGTISGPVRIPYLYNGKDKTFFSYAYERIDESRPMGSAYGQGTLTVPTEAQRRGDFSDLLRLGSNYQIYDPFSGRQDGSVTRRSPVPGNIIPGSVVSANKIAANILSYFSLPNTAGTADGANNLYRGDDPEVVDYWNHLFKVDHNFSPSHRIFVRGNGYQRDSKNRDWFRSAATGEFTQWRPRSVAVDDVYFLNPTTFLNMRYSLYSFGITQGSDQQSDNFDLASLGFPKSYVDSIPSDVRRFPVINLTGYYNTTDTYYDYNHHSNAFEGSLTMLRGKHTIKFGADARNYRNFLFNIGSISTGSFTFNETYTRETSNSLTAPRGQGLAALLYGVSTTNQVLRGTTIAEQSTYWSGFVQDSIRVSRSLTLNFGVRYELEGPVTERFNRAVRGYDFSTVSPLDAPARAAYVAAPIPELPVSAFRLTGGLTYVGVNGQPRTIHSRDTNNFAPRVGVAYLIGNKTVLRAGWGMYYGTLGVTRVQDVRQEGFRLTTVQPASQDAGLSFVATLDNPFPTGVLIPKGNADGIMTYVGQDIRFYNEHPTTPVSHSYSVGITRELPGRVVVGVNYIGRTASSLERIDVPLRVLSPEYLNTDSWRSPAMKSNNEYLAANVANPLAGLVPNSGSLNAATVRREILMRSNPQYMHFNNAYTTVNDGSSRYDSGNLSVERRFANSFTLNGVYGWSKTVEEISKLNGNLSPLERRISDQDRAHRLVIGGIWELPFGRGRKFANSSNVVDKFVGGWQVQGIYQAQSGAPLTWSATDYFFNGDIKDITLPVSERNREHMFNTQAGFILASNEQPQYHYRTFPTRLANVRGDGTNLWDLSVIKNTQIKERYRVQFRGEFLNAMNHVTFQAPNMSPTSTAFGTSTAQYGYPRRIQLGLKLVF